MPGTKLHAWLLLASGCATTFMGSAEVEGGRAGCEKKCAGVGLTMQAFVFMGEYSTACVCEPPGRTQGAEGSPAAAAISVGVMRQLRDAADMHCADTDCSRF
jgi:hypothetical protein